MRAPCTVQGPMPGMTVSSAMSSSSGSLLKTSWFSLPSDVAQALFAIVDEGVARAPDLVDVGAAIAHLS